MQNNCSEIYLVLTTLLKNLKETFCATEIKLIQAPLHTRQFKMALIHVKALKQISCNVL